MLKSEIISQYPWYEKHQNAVSTIVACLQIDIQVVLETLDKKLGQSAKSEPVKKPNKQTTTAEAA